MSGRYLYLLVFAVGIASLGTEIAAARLMAPFFGASTIVWANTIGVVLVSLAVGYWLGGKLGDRHPEARLLCRMVLIAAALLALIPFAARPFLDLSVDALDQISAGAFAGSLAGVLVLVAVPMVMLGACSPWAVRLMVTDVEHAGEVAGRLYAVSTAGSLLGTMGSALLLIPFIGTQRTFLGFAFLLAVVAAAGLGWRYLAVPAALAAVLAVPVGTLKASGAGESVLWEDETTEGYARVVEEADGDRRLELNEGVAEHSIYRPGSHLTGDYWDSLQVLPFAALRPPPGRIAILGNAAGTAERSYGHYFPHAEVDGVEIDGELTEVGKRYFGLRLDDRLRAHTADARPWLRDSEGRFDLILVDAYRQPYIPFYLTTREFFELARDRLAPGGAVIVNVGHPEDNDDLERVVGRTMAEVFAHVARDPVKDSNTLLLASDAPISSELLLRRRAVLPLPLRNQAAIDAARLEPRLPGGEVYTDDRAPVEWLIDRSILGYAQGD